MTLDTIFTVRNEHLERLNSDEGVLFFADLLRAETRRLGLPITSVNISSGTNVPDGGVDAAIDGEVPQESGLAKTGRTVFQVKAGDFNGRPPADRMVAEASNRRYQALVAAVERAINEADPIGPIEIGASTGRVQPRDRYDRSTYCKRATAR